MGVGKFTGEQTRRIDELINNDFADATAEDIKLYAAWEVERARTSDEFEAMRKKWDDEAKATIEMQRESIENATDALDALVEKAIERYERLD